MTGPATGPRPGPANVLETPAARIDPAEAAQVAERLWGLTGRAWPLDGERDRNFRFDAEDGSSHLLRFVNPVEEDATTDFQVGMLLHLEAAGTDLPVPRITRPRDGAAYGRVRIASGPEVAVHLSTFFAGTPLYRSEGGAAQMAAVGSALAGLDRALADFHHPAAARALFWDAAHPERLAPYLHHIPADLRGPVDTAFARFRARVAPALPGLRRQVVHNDFNPHNIIVDGATPDRLTGIIDFGDALEGPLILDLATALAYQVDPGPDPLARMRPMARAYVAELPLTGTEAGLVFDLACTRMALSVAISSWRAHDYPENRDYILRNIARTAGGLTRLTDLPDHEGRAALAAACGSDT